MWRTLKPEGARVSPHEQKQALRKVRREARALHHSLGDKHSAEGRWSTQGAARTISRFS